MTCRVCGDDNATFRVRARSFMCQSCAPSTPRKVGRRTFAIAYWGSAHPPVHPRTQAEFYDDYLTSDLNLVEYVKATTEIGDLDISPNGLARLGRKKT